jgi:SpoVK/Ycf46/Vps4 family AAA+-type ATPase
MIIPSNLATKIDSPEFMSLLHSLKNSEDTPLVLIIEDGDTCLVKRKGESSSAISALLNLTDGIVGKLLDIRVIITTNMNIYEMDDAVLRPGRLGGRIVVKELSYEDSLKIYRRLMKDSDIHLPDRRDYTLAEIYAIYNNDGQLPEFMLDLKKEKKVVGFSFETPETNKFVNKSE